jgi:hypothetical protein
MNLKPQQYPKNLTKQWEKKNNIKNNNNNNKYTYHFEHSF